MSENITDEKPTIEELLGELGYCFSSPEGEHFYAQILARKYDKARKKKAISE